MFSCLMLCNISEVSKVVIHIKFLDITVVVSQKQSQHNYAFI